MTPPPRVWVTGIGIVSPLARGAAATMDRLLAGDRAIGRLSLFELPGAAPGLAAEIADLHAADVAPPGEELGWSRTDAMAVIAVREALAHAGLDPARTPIDLALGGTTAGMFETEATLAALSRDPSAIAPLQQMLSHPLSSTADHVRAAVGPFRRVRSVCSACSSGANAILLAATWIRAGRSRCAIAGGADGLCRLTYAGFSALSALSADPCRPFDRRRNGLNLGEAAAFLVLEPEDAARARGARPLAELRGFAVGAEAHHITNPEGEGVSAARVMSEAIARAGLTPADVDYVNAHGTATALNDAMETAAIVRCFGAEVARVAVSSSKGQIGHTLAAAGAIEAAISVMAIERGALPPTVGLEEVDPGSPLALVTTSRPAVIRAAISNSFGFGGTDSVLVFTALTAFPEPPPVRAPSRIVVTGGATVGPLGVLDARASLAYLAPGPSPAPGAIDVRPADHLDVAKARRLDRTARLITIATAAAGAEAGIAFGTPSCADVGAISGSAFGSVDGSTAFMRRVYDKGAKFASPAEFPNLVLSSPIGHTSIYLGLRGPVFAVSELEATAESALVSAIELLSGGVGGAIFAGSAEEWSVMVDRCLGPLCSGITDRGPRSEGASTLLLETGERADARSATALARVAWWTSWRGDGADALADAPRPPASASIVVVGRAGDHPALVGSPWSAVPIRAVADRAGDHEGAGGFGAVAAAAAIAAGEATAALVLGVARDRGFAILLVPDRP